MKWRGRRLLLALYPRSWRRRYGDEFLQYLADVEADQPQGTHRRTFNIVLNAVPIQVAHRPATSAALAFLVSGTIAVLGLYGPGSGASRDPLVWGWRTIDNPVIITSGHQTYFGQTMTTQEGTGSPVTRFHAVSRSGAKVTIDCRPGQKCRIHPDR